MAWTSLLTVGMTGQIYLVGYMGSGKSTVGRILADELGWELVDTDDTISRFVSWPIPRIFRRLGEDSFRQLETRILVSTIQSGGNQVVSTGGGLPVNPTNRRLMEEAGTPVALRVKPDVAMERMNPAGRPLAQEFQDFRDRWRQRQPVYDWPEIQVDTCEQSPAEVAQTILVSLDSSS